MKKPTATRLAGLAAVVALTATMSACAGGQSVAEACSIAQDEMTKASSSIQSDLSTAMGNVTSGEKVDFSSLFQPIVDGLKAAQDKITNDEVKAPLTAFTDEFTSFTQVFEGFEMPDVTNIDPSDADAMAKLQAAQDKAQEISTKSQEANTKLTEKANDLQKVCNG